MFNNIDNEEKILLWAAYFADELDEDELEDSNNDYEAETEPLIEDDEDLPF